MSDTEPTTAALRRRRGVTKASITKLSTGLSEFEAKIDDPMTLGHAQKLLKKLESLDSEFKQQHLMVIDSIPEDDQLDDNLAKEQNELDEHDLIVDDLSLRLEKLIQDCSKSSSSGQRIASRRLTNLYERLSHTSTLIGKLKGAPEEFDALEQYQEQVAEYKAEMSDIRHYVLSECTSTESDELMRSIVIDIDKLLFDIGLSIRKKTVKPSASAAKSVSITSTEAKMVKLPKLDVPTFNGNILQWLTFWEQFSVAIHDRVDITKPQKMAYLRQALKHGSARNMVEGLSRTGEQYDEAIDCLENRYNKPRLIHQAHVKEIIEVPSLRDNSAKEIRRLHDVLQQHLRALKAMRKEPSSPFITSLIEMKLDNDTRFEWQKHSQASDDVPDYNDLLKFLNLRAQAAESAMSGPRRPGNNRKGQTPNLPGKEFSHLTHTQDPSSSDCVVCNERHPLYACKMFKDLPHDKMVEVVRSHNLCLNCLKPGHHSKKCTSLSKCRKCQRPHHTLLHIEPKPETQALLSTTKQSEPVTTPVSNHAATGFASNTLLMTCQVLVHSPDGIALKARALLDSGSSTSFVSDRLAQNLHLPKTSRDIKISGIAGISHHSPLHSVVNFDMSPLHTKSDKINVSTVIIPRVTSDLPQQPVHHKSTWSHLHKLNLADPDFGRPGRIDILLGVDVYANIVLQGRRTGPPDAPVAFETKFGWVLAGKTGPISFSNHCVTVNHVSTISGDELLSKFWEVEETPKNRSMDSYSQEERLVVRHFKENHHKSKDGRFVVPLPRQPGAKALGESRTQAVKRFLSLERSLHSKNQFKDFSEVIEEYFEMDHAELVPTDNMQKPSHQVFYLPMHAVYKESSTTTKIRAVFDASAKSSTGVSLNDTLMVGPTVHPPLIDVLIRFRQHRIALTADISKMYRAIQLAPNDRDFHRFVWRKDTNDTLKDYRMTRVTFGISASSFAANMAVLQNANDHSSKYPLAAQAVKKSFYVDDCLTGEDTIPAAIELQTQLSNLFTEGSFLLRKWNASEPAVLDNLPSDLKDLGAIQKFQETTPNQYTKTLGIEWNSQSDQFRLTISKLPDLDSITKRQLVSDIAKTFDVLGWFSPTLIKAKILLQRVWEHRIDWDDTVPLPIHNDWLQWRTELHLLSEKSIPRCYFDKSTQITSFELHGFSDASEHAYAAVVYLRMTDPLGNVQVSLVTSKTKVAPIKRLTIPRLELCGAQLLAHLLSHARQVLEIPLSHTCAWTDSTIVLNWLDGSPRRFKTFVGNRISTIMELIPPDKWNHVNGLDNPADCASRGLFPSELLRHSLWWEGPSWLRQSPAVWPKQTPLTRVNLPEEERAVTLLTTITDHPPVISFDRYSSFNRLKRVTALILRFINNCRDPHNRVSSSLATSELCSAEGYWIRVIQETYFRKDLESLMSQDSLDPASCLLSLHPFVDQHGLLRVGGRQKHSMSTYESKHPLILHGRHPVSHLIIRTEHLRLLHAGPTLLASSLNQRYHIVGGRKVVRSITRACVTCQRNSVKPQPQMLGQLPIERLTPGPVFDKVGVDYAGPLLIKYGHVRKPTIVKSYVCVFVSLTVKAVHLELVSDLTTDAFIACLRRFISRRGIPSLIWSDHGSNFVGAAREIKDLYEFLRSSQTQTSISNFLSTHNVNWKFIPPQSPNFGGLWEAAVKSMKKHLKRIVGNVKLTFEELSTVLTQIEACLNSRPLVPLNNDDDGIEALTPGHFLIGRPLQTLPDDSFVYIDSVSSLRRWKLCQALLSHFWKRWSREYVTQLNRFTKWNHPSRNIAVGDLVILKDDSPLPTRWPLARVVGVHPGGDGFVRVATVKTTSGTYNRPVTKLALLLPALSDSD